MKGNAAEKEEEIREHYPIVRAFHPADFYESGHHLHILYEMEAGMRHGGFRVLTGGIGTGKTTLLSHLHTRLAEKGEVVVARSLALEKERVSLATLLLALFYDLSPEKKSRLPKPLEKRERAVCELIRKRNKPVALLIDDAHDLPRKTFADLRCFMETLRERGGILSVVLAGRPELAEYISSQVE